MKNIFKMINLICIFFIFLFFSDTSLANEYFFNEEFLGDKIDLNNWIVNKNNGSALVNGGELRLSSTSQADGFPFIRVNRNIFPDGNFSIEWRFKYSNTSYNYGNGIAITDILPINRTTIHPNSENEIMGNWVAGGSNIALNSFICNISGESCNGAFYLGSGQDFDKFHIIKINYINNRYYFYLNDQKLFESEETTRIPSYIWLGNPINPSTSVIWPSFSVDYIRVTKLPDKILDVPFFSQNDESWGSNLYDHLDKTLDEVGCAVSSSAMLLNYYGLSVIPFNNQVLNPGTLNYWLTNKPVAEGLVGNSPGYFSNGDISWIAINQLARYFRPNYSLEIMKGGLENSDTEFDSFKENIDKEKPEILWVSGDGNYWGNSGSHFIIGSGYDNDSIYINDPEDLYNKIPASFNIRKRLAFFDDEEWNNWGSLQIHTDAKVNVLIEDTQGKKLGKDSSGNIFEEIAHGNYLEGNLLGMDNTNNNPVNLYLTHVSKDSKYKLKISGDKSEIELVLASLNSDNSSYENKIVREIDGGKEYIYELTFHNSENNEIKEFVEPIIVDYESLRKYIESEYEKGNIINKRIKNMLLANLNVVEKFDEWDKDKIVKLLLNNKILLIEKFIPKFIKQETGMELIRMIEFLRK